MILLSLLSSLWDDDVEQYSQKLEDMISCDENSLIFSMNCKINLLVSKQHDVVIWHSEKKIKSYNEIQEHNRKNCTVKSRFKWFLRSRLNVKQKFLLI